MNTFSITASLLTHSLAWALLYSLAQGLFVYTALYILLKALPNMHSRVKHYLSFGAFASMFLWFADTWATEYQKLKGIAVYITQPGTGSAVSTTYIARTISTGHLQSPVVHRWLPQIEHYFPFIILIYSIGLSFMLFRFLVNVLQLKALRTQGIIQPDDHWNHFISQWQTQFDITRRVKLFVSDRVNVPMMLGTIKPIILLPVATMNYLSTEQVEAIILHELAHIKRHDYLLNIFQTITEALLFFNPFVWLISGIIRREREHCCDDLVVGYSGDPLPYAKALTILETNRALDNRLALAATGNKNQLLNRIKRIMEMKKTNMNKSQLTIIIVAIVAITLFAAMFTFTPSFAQKAKNTKKNDTTSTTTSKSVYHYKTVTIDKNGKKTVTEKTSSTPIKDKDYDDDADADANATASSSSSSSSYSYSFSDMDSDDMKKMVKKILITTKNAMKNIDLKELERQIEKEMENAENEVDKIDWKRIGAEVDRGIAEIDRELAKDNRNKKITIQVRREMEHAKEELGKAKRELEKTKRHIYVSANAGRGRNTNVTIVTEDGEDVMPEDAVAPVAPADPVTGVPAPPTPPRAPAAPRADNDIEAMLDKMENDGLIDRSKKYTIEKDNGKLYINGNKQSEEVLAKYNKYLSHKSVSIKGHKGSLSIAINN